MTVAANIDLQEASRTRWDVIVVGAGPAGAMAAHQLARAGASVLLVDRAGFPRYKVCGGCLNLRALAALEEAGLGHLPATHGAQPLRELHLTAAGSCGSTVGPHAKLPLPGGVALSRSALDAALAAAAMQQGARFLSHAAAALGPAGGEERIVRITCADETVECHAAVVLAADGLSGGLTHQEAPSHVAPTSRIGAGAISAVAPNFYTTGTVFMACGRRGYVGLVRVESEGGSAGDGRLNLGAALDAAFVRAVGSLAGAVRSILSEAGLPEIPDLDTLTWHGTPALTRRASTVSGPRLLVLGDAAGYVEPFTGEGMAWALTSGIAIAPLAQRAAVGPWDSALAAEWTRRHRALVTQRQGVCRAIALALRHPTLVSGVVRVLARAPRLAQPVVAHLNARVSAPGSAGFDGAKGLMTP